MADEKYSVKENTIIYDTVRIGPAVQQEYPDRLTSFTELADAEEVSFFNTRSMSNGPAYCNLTGKGSSPYPLKFDSFGIRFVYPTPNADSSSVYQARRQSAKIFQHIIPEHSWVFVQINEDKIMMLKPHMIPPGYGPEGCESREDQNTAGTYSLISNSGIASWNNRYQFTGEMLEIPRNTPWKAVIAFSNYAKILLRALGDVQPLEINEGPNTPNEALIEISARGLRFVQQRGQYRYV